MHNPDSGRRNVGENFTSEAWERFVGGGLRLREDTLRGVVGEVLGLVLDGKRQETRNTDKRSLRLWSGLGAMLKRRRVGGWKLEMVLGHTTHFSTARLGIFHCCYSYVQEHDTQRAELRSECARRERNFPTGDGVHAVLLESDADVYASDASLVGYGLTQSRWSPSDSALVRMGVRPELTLSPDFEQNDLWKESCRLTEARHSGGRTKVLWMLPQASLDQTLGAVCGPTAGSTTMIFFVWKPVSWNLSRQWLDGVERHLDDDT